MNTRGTSLVVVAWGLLGIFILAAVGAATYSAGLAYGPVRPGSVGHDGNAIAEPILLVLSRGVPILAGMATFACFLASRRLVSWVHPISLLVASLFSAGAFVTYASTFFRPLFGDANVFAGVWWIAPFS